MLADTRPSQTSAYHGDRTPEARARWRGNGSLQNSRIANHRRGSSLVRRTRGRAAHEAPPKRGQRAQSLPEGSSGASHICRYTTSSTKRTGVGRLHGYGKAWRASFIAVNCGCPRHPQNSLMDHHLTRPPVRLPQAACRSASLTPSLSFSCLQPVVLCSCPAAGRRRRRAGSKPPRRPRRKERRGLVRGRCLCLQPRDQHAPGITMLQASTCSRHQHA